MESLKILLVEDDETDRMMITRTLKRYGARFKVTEAALASAGLDEIRKAHFDCVLLDFNLPDKNGEEFIDELHGSGDRSTPIVIITGIDDESFGLKMVAGGAQDYIVKGKFDGALLIRVIRYAVERKKLEEENKRLFAQVEKTEMLDQIEAQNEMLEQKNIALRELLNQLEKEKRSIGERIRANVEGLILPTIAKVRQKATTIDMGYIDILEENLRKITSDFGLAITKDLAKLTPREIEVCNMIRTGMTCKEIAQLLNLSPETIKKQRKNIRKKLGLTRSKNNLGTFLKNSAKMN